MENEKKESNNKKKNHIKAIAKMGLVGLMLATALAGIDESNEKNKQKNDKN